MQRKTSKDKSVEGNEKGQGKEGESAQKTGRQRRTDARRWTLTDIRNPGYPDRYAAGLTARALNGQRYRALSVGQEKTKLGNRALFEAQDENEIEIENGKKWGKNGECQK